LNLCAPTRMWEAGYSLAPLARAPQLRGLALIYYAGEEPTMSKAQVGELRTLSWLESVYIDWKLDASLLHHLLAPPHTMRWRELFRLPDITDSVASLLVSLPLRALTATLRMPHADFLEQLPQLTSLNLRVAAVPSDTARILRAVGACAQLQALYLTDGFSENELQHNSAQLGACLSRLPRLEKLMLSSATALTSLEFLAQGSLSRTLTELRLSNFAPRVSLSELPQVLQLRALQSLELCNVFDAPLSASDQLLFQPPIQLEHMPQLTSFEHRWSSPAPDAEEEEDF